MTTSQYAQALHAFAVSGGQERPEILDRDTPTDVRSSNVQAAIDHAAARGILGTNAPDPDELDDDTDPEVHEDEGYDPFEDSYDPYPDEWQGVISDANSGL